MRNVFLCLFFGIALFQILTIHHSKGQEKNAPITDDNTSVLLVSWSLQGTPGNQPLQPGESHQGGITAYPLYRGEGLNPSSAANGFNANGWQHSEGNYFGFGISTLDGVEITLDTLFLGMSSSATGPREFALRWDMDDFVSDLHTWTLSQPGQPVFLALDLTGLVFLKEKVNFRIVPRDTVAVNGNTITGTGTSRIIHYQPGNLPFSITGRIKSESETPQITIAREQKDLGYGSIQLPGTESSYSLMASHLADSLKITAPPPFKIRTEGGAFQSSIALHPSQVKDSLKVWISYSSGEPPGFYTGSITHSSRGAADVSLSIRVHIMDPKNWEESFNKSCEFGLPKGWTSYSVNGDLSWDCSGFGRRENQPTNNSPYGLQANGFVPIEGPTAQETWLISPSFDLEAFDYPLLSFWSRVAFEGPRLSLKISYDYLDGDPLSANWKTLSDRFARENRWTYSQPLNLVNHKEASVRFAFVYTSHPEQGAARWSIDDIRLADSGTPPAPFLQHSLGYIDYWHFTKESGKDSARVFTVEFYDPVAPLKVSSHPAFQLSKDGQQYTTSLIYSIDELNEPQSISVKFSPSSGDEGVFAGPIVFESDTLKQRVGYLSASTINGDNTLDLLTWNVEWFGSKEFGPEDVGRQRKNVGYILGKLDADLVALQEIVALEELEKLVEEQPEYGYIVSPATSRGEEDFDASQKLAFLYKKSVISPISTRVLLLGVTADMLEDYPSDPDRFWASGRLPFLLEAKVNINGKPKNVNFVNIHARSNGGGESPANPRYAMRKFDVGVLKDTLDRYYSHSPLAILGDFNDALDATVSDSRAPTVGSTATSYLAFMLDSSHYHPASLKLSRAGLRTYPAFPNVIDNMIINSKLKAFWLEGSMRVVNPLEWVPDYLRSTSDHLPVSTRFTWACENYTGMVLGKEWFCNSSDTLSFMLSEMPDEILSWEISNDEGETYIPVENDQKRDTLMLTGLTEPLWVRAMVKSNGCDAPMATKAIEINPIKLPTPTLSSARNWLVSITGEYTYHWMRNDSLLATTTHGRLPYSSAGIYQVRILHPAGCEAWSAPLNILQPDSGPALQLFPNPAKDRIKLTHEKLTGLVRLEIRNIGGALLYSATTGQENLEIDLHLMKPGWYWLRLSYDSGEKMIRRFLITK